MAARERKEDYYLDLAGEEGWPKDKLRTKIQAIRTERAGITASLEQAERQLDTGKQVFMSALDLLDDPQAMYERGNEQVRTILNQAFLTRLYVNGRKITGQELREPFNVLVGAYDVLYWHGQAPAQGQAYYRRGDAPGSAQTDSRGGILTDTAPDLETLIDSLGLALQGRGSSKTVMVGDTGIEPVTSTVSRCSLDWFGSASWPVTSGVRELALRVPLDSPRLPRVS